MAEISKITLPNGTTYDIKDTTARNTGKVTGVKGNAENSYRTGNVNLTADNVNAITKNQNGNTQFLVRPTGLRGVDDVTLQTLFNTVRANRLAFLPADQIIIEQTTDGGVTWVSAGVSDSVKKALFSETRPNVPIPKINNVQNILCGLRITFTAMKYNVPEGTAETEKYNYWNSTYVSKHERYCTLKEFYFWLTSVNNSISIKAERATGANPNNWSTIFNDSSFFMTGWSGNDYIRFGQSTFGGDTNQTANHWNYRLTLMTRGINGTDTMGTGFETSSQSISEIRGYGNNWWGKSNEYMANDKIYTHDANQNVTFPARVIANDGFFGNLSGNATSANTATAVATQGNGTTDVYRHVWFSDGSTETKRAHDDDFTYNPALNTLKVANIDGKINNHTINSDVPANAKFTDTTYAASTVSIGSASTGTAIPADDITAWTTNTPTVVTPATVVTGGTTASITPVTKKTVVVGGTTSSITPVTKKTVVTSASGATATVSNGVLTLTNGSFGTGDSVTTGTAVNVYTGLTTGDSVTTGTAVTVYKSLTTGPAATVTAGTSASLSYTAKSIPNISVTSKNVVTSVTAS